MIDRMISRQGVTICSQGFGRPENPAMLLVMGATASMLWWPDELCVRLADAGFFVIRYDNRDTGRSTSYPPGAPPYSLDELVEDAAAVLDGYDIRAAHLVGMSLGGMIAQLAALKHPQRVLSLVAISSSKLGDDDPELPGIDDRFLDHFATAGSLDWSSEAAVTDFRVAGARLSTGSTQRFDEARARALAVSEFRRATNPGSMMNHAMLTGGEAWQKRLGDVAVPFLVIHGTDDPILPYPHGVALADAVPGPSLVALEGAGHELHADDWTTIVDAIVAHSRR